MKIYKLFILSLIFISFSCMNDQEEDKPDKSSGLIWKGEPAAVISDAEASGEIEQKLHKLNTFLDENNYEGILLTQVRNVNWITAGKANTQIVLNKDVGAASLLIMKNGKKYLICNDSEAGRLMDEQLGALGYELKRYNWYEANDVNDVRGNIIRSVAGSSRITSDIPFPGTELLPPTFKKIRYSLSDPEIKRYTWLGEKTTEAVAEVCRKVTPGMNEYEIEAITAAELRSRGIMPTVLLISVDERIYKYRHGLPGGAELKKYAMINVVAEKWGMPVAVTRFVHFGALPDELKSKLEKAAVINAKYEEATVPGKSSAKIFEQCKQWYNEAGYENEWMKHHQGGAIGYDDREYVIYPGVQETVMPNQAFAWNPTITGAKIEDTIITGEDGVTSITRSAGWPLINVKLNGKIYPQPGILIRDAETGKVIQQEDINIEGDISSI